MGLSLEDAFPGREGITTAQAGTVRPVRIEINKPEFLHDLCDYLSRHGFVAVRASLKHADVLVPDAGSDLAALLLLKARIRAWGATHPGINVRVDQYA